MANYRRIIEISLSLLLIVCVCVLVYSRLQFVHIPFERDEGEYAYVGQLILKGLLPYHDAYNMKLPGTYFMYALMMRAGGESVEAIRYGTIVCVLLTTLFIFLLTRKLYDGFTALLAATVYIALLATFGGEGLMSNCEQFVMLFAVIGIYLLLYYDDLRSPWLLFVSGILLACAVLMKQQGYPFVLFALAILAWQIVKRLSPDSIKGAAAFCTGGIVPVMGLLIYISSNGLWAEFKFLTIDYAREYAKICSWDSSKWMFNNSLKYIGKDAMPLWQVIAWTPLLLLLPFKIEHRSKIIALLLCAVAAVSAGWYFRIHYFILAYFSLVLAFGAIVYSVSNRGDYIKLVVRFGACLLIILFIIMHRGSLFPNKPLKVYLDHYEWSGFADMQRIATDANHYLKKDEKLAMFSNEPEIYFFAKRVAASPYLYNYPFYENQKYAMRMTHEYIQQITGSKSNFFIYCPSWETNDYGAKQVLDNWWNEYKKGFELQCAYCIDSGTDTIHYYSKAQVQADTSWNNHPNFQFWKRR